MADGEEKPDGHQITRENLALAISNQRQCSVEEVDIKDFSSKAGSNKGENFTCLIYAVEVDAVVKGKAEKFHFIAKCLPGNAFRAQWINEVKYLPCNAKENVCNFF